MTQKSSILALLILVAALSGCNMANGPNSTAIQQVGGEKNKAAGEQQDTQLAANNLREETRLANERAKLAEEKAEFERQKREHAETLLKEAQEANEEHVSAASVPQSFSAPAPRQQYANHASPATYYVPKPEPEFTWISWESDDPLPNIGDVIEADDGVQYEIIGRRGYCLKGVPLDEI